jgi:agmatinase
MIDPLERWAEFGEKPDFAGLLTYGGAPTTQDPAELRGFDVAVVGAPTDDLVSDRPGTRFAPRSIRAASCPPGPHLEVGVDAFEALRIVDFGDAPVLPADPLRTHQAIEAMIHFDTHTDTGAEVFGVEISHGTFIRRLVDEGAIDPTRYAQIGLRGYWPGEAEFAWQAERGITSLFAHDVRDLGIREVVRRAVEAVGPGPVYLTVDVDVLDPAFLGGGTGTPEPGGMSSTELLLAVRTVAAEVDLIGTDVVEVIPTAVGSADLSSLVADRIVREALTGIALRRRAAAATGAGDGRAAGA